ARRAPEPAPGAANTCLDPTKHYEPAPIDKRAQEQPVCRRPAPSRQAVELVRPRVRRVPRQGEEAVDRCWRTQYSNVESAWPRRNRSLRRVEMNVSLFEGVPVDE